MMITLTLLVVLLADSPAEAGRYAQNQSPGQQQEIDAPEGTRIASAQVSGLNIDRLSPGLRRDINALTGTPLARQRLTELASRIEQEQPDMVAAVRTAAAPNNEVRVVFLVARISDDRRLESNINARYIIDSVEIKAVPQERVSQALRDELQALVGQQLDNDKADALEKKLTAELPGYRVRRQIERGSERGRIRLIFNARLTEEARWLRFAQPRSKFLYHSDQAWSFLLDIPMGTDDFRVTANLALDNGDDTLEDYSGYGARVESRQAVGGRLGLGVEFGQAFQDWRDRTLAAVATNPGVPAAYDERNFVAPSATFALSKQLRVSGGLSIAELEPLQDGLPSQMANGFTFSAGYDREWRVTGDQLGNAGDAGVRSPRHRLDALFSLRTGVDALESDLGYKRYLGSGSYLLTWGRRNELLASGMAGGITGQAPLFERFALGDSSTLRGWDKYDISPAGGDAMLYSSVEYRNHGLALFLDSGSVWDRGQDARARFSTGFGFHTRNVFFTLGFPLNTDDLRTVFTAGVRF